MKKIYLELGFSENTIKWANEKSKKQGIDISTYLISKIETEVFREYIEGKFIPVPKYKGKKKNDKRKNK